LAKKCGLDGIEWGGDVHAPPGDTARAEEIRTATAAAGLQVLSYGSYYRIGEGHDFPPVLATARALGADTIRVWAGAKGSAKYTPEERAAAVADAVAIADGAAEYGITVATEYHRNTLTDTSGSAVALLREVGRANFKTYWQPNLQLSHEANLGELTEVLPYLVKLHVFHWNPDSSRLPLSEGVGVWGEYFAKATGQADAAILEFVLGDKTEQCEMDAGVLVGLVNP